MHPRTNGDRLLRGINAEEMLGKLTNLGQALVQLASAEVAHVEMHGLAVRGTNSAALTFFVPERLADAIAWPEFHRLIARPGIGWAQSVIL
jgi:hypothetical protein